jgi:hypothetical protein
MKYNRCIAIITALFFIAVSGLAMADVLPGPVPENQVLSIASIVDGVGIATEDTSLVWQIGDAGLTELPSVTDTFVGRFPVGILPGYRSGSIAYVTYSDTIMSNGGQIAEVKSFTMDTHAKSEGLYNIEAAKVLTYTSQSGSHLMGQESYVLDVAGNWSGLNEDIICVFARAPENLIPAFCNKVTASSKLTQVTTAQIETVGSLTAVGRTANVPAALNYEISVTPDANSASGYADGIFTTLFTASIMEGRSDGWPWDAARLRETLARNYAINGGPWPRLRDPFTGWDELASTLTFVDSATFSGGVNTFNKDFSYQSGIYCEKCNL